jgi:hypothetical protein
VIGNRPTRVPLASPLAAALLAAAAVAFGETADLGTDRDAFTPNTHTIAPGTLLHEASYVYIDNLAARPTNNYPEWLLRIGATEWAPRGTW